LCDLLQGQRVIILKDGFPVVCTVKYEMADYEDDKPPYLEFLLYESNDEDEVEVIGLRDYNYILMQLGGEYYLDVADIELNGYNWCNL
jgi:hypothetical protein